MHTDPRRNELLFENWCPLLSTTAEPFGVDTAAPSVNFWESLFMLFKACFSSWRPQGDCAGGIRWKTERRQHGIEFSWRRQIAKRIFLERRSHSSEGGQPYCCLRADGYLKGFKAELTTSSCTGPSPSFFLYPCSLSFFWSGCPDRRLFSFLSAWISKVVLRLYHLICELFLLSL